MRSHLAVMVSRTLLAACLAVSLTVFAGGGPAQAVIYDVTTTITAAQNLTDVIMILGGKVSQNTINITAGGPTTYDFYFSLTGSIQGPYTIMGLYHDGQGDHVAVGLNLSTALWALDVAGSPASPLDWQVVFDQDTNESLIAGVLKSGPSLMRDLLITSFFHNYNQLCRDNKSFIYSKCRSFMVKLTHAAHAN